MRDRLLTLLKVAVSLGLVTYIVTRPAILQADWSAILTGLRLGPWLLALLLYFSAIGLNVLKWQVLLRTLDVYVPYHNLFRHNLVGLFFANLPLSMIGGDIARGWDLARSSESQATQVAVSVLVDRLVGLAGFLAASVLGLGYAVAGLHRPELGWLWTTMSLVLAVFALAFAVLMSQRLRRSAERLFGLGPLRRMLPLYQNLSDAVQVYRARPRELLFPFVLALATVVVTCFVNYLAAVTVNASFPVVWTFVLTPLTPFALYIPSIASGLGVNQAVYAALYHNLTGLIPEAAKALAMSLAMQVLIYASSLPGAVLWWRRQESSVSKPA